MTKSYDIFEEIEGLTPVDPSVLFEFQRAMNEEVIPEIIKDVERRCKLAEDSRHWRVS
jgi:hypothetical protein